jgi:CBS domain-containing protein
MLVQDLMTRAPVVVRPSATLSVAAARMRGAGVGSVVVVEDSDPVGILTDRDPPHPLAIQMDTDVETCLDRMVAFHVRRILIVDDEALVGVVSLDDILMHLGTLMARASALIESEVAIAKCAG